MNIGSLVKNIGRMIGGWQSPTAVERAILGSLVQSSEDSAKDIVEAQVKAVSRTKMISAGRIIALDSDHLKKIAPALVNQDVELVAWSGAVSRDSNVISRFLVNVIHGTLDSIMFTRKQDLDLQPGAFRIDCFSTTNLAGSEKTGREKPVAEASEVVRVTLQSVGARHWFIPKETSKRNALIQLINSALPPDFLEVINHCDGFIAEGYEFYGISGRPLFWPDGTNLFILAEDPDCMASVAVLLDSQRQEYLLLDQENASYEPCGVSLIGAMGSLKTLLQEKSKVDD